MLVLCTTTVVLVNIRRMRTPAVRVKQDGGVVRLFAPDIP
jgi:hypothetical protein